MPARNRRLPRHLSWPLTSTDLASGLGEAPSDALQFDFGSLAPTDGTLLTASWTPPLGSNYGNGPHPRWWSSVWILVAPVPSGERAAARKLLREQALPGLRQWIDEARTGSEAWALSRHTISWKLPGRRLHLSHDGQPYRPVELP
ncbi:hypothetical protein [Kitasatospora cheerisanensis]|uniref:Uncharacterized protein n=1 Tax=Kitasatospora cheerisanensis KCTC 2395 TaxID=1348663 RepID=A0A066ZA69_9ACTN|nr:hypothetical protein [Kitasatospora cheerisanensis]KDN87065.1 hypothetical protein KCH_11500 [Kitasatospora cheerisanensis KCTC 2395]